MASTGKKGKKSKEKKLSLQDFLAKSGPTTGGTTQVAVQKYSSWAEECEEDEERKIEIIQLPTAPRAARILEDNSIPYDPPFYAKVSNLPFDLSEADVDEFFLDHNIHIKEMKLARDDANDRLRGFGHIELETREDLMDAIMLTDPVIRNRRIRIEFTMEPDSISGRTVRKRYDNYTPRDSANESTNWRDRKESNFESVDSRDGGGRDHRENRRNYQPRSNFQNRHDTNNNDDGGSGGNWRLGDRPNNDSPPPERRRFGNDRNDRRDNDRRGPGGGGNRYDRDRREPRDEPAQERPKIYIAPRTLPLPELNFPKEEELERGTRKISLNGDHEDENNDDSGLAEDDDRDKVQKEKVPKPNIFGDARPVDTSTRDREIEEKLETGRQDRFKAEKDKREKDRDAGSNTSQSGDDKKDVIVIRTEGSRRQEEPTNWRKRDDTSSNGSMDNKVRSGNRQMGGRHDDRPRQFNKDNNRSYNNRDRRDDRRDGDRRDDRRDMDRRNDDRRDGDRRDDYRNNRDRRDNNMRRGNDSGPRRDMEIRRDDREPRGDNRDSKEPRDMKPRDKNHDMPKLVDNSGPNLHTSNAFAGLDDEVYDD
ncbi:eukaryotic translation initiation factor 4B [Chironomus tepperi]|uniref:eukaryotic translation initiation factor 4B n=1 Tax=Chironomus tepperi TaxID=113505 RepID=UPI00391F34A3